MISYDLKESGPALLPPPGGSCTFCAEPHKHGGRGSSCPLRVGLVPPSRLLAALGDWIYADEMA